MHEGLRFRVLQRDDFTCTYCGRRPPGVVLEVDHLTPKSRGGPDKAWNLVTACRECNRGKRDVLLSAVHRARLRRDIRQPEREWVPSEPEFHVCRGCGNRIYYESDSFCTCRSREPEYLCECGEVLDDEADEQCASCYYNYYVYCVNCATEEQVPGYSYCAGCLPDFVAPPRFVGGVGIY